MLIYHNKYVKTFYREKAAVLTMLRDDATALQHWEDFPIIETNNGKICGIEAWTMKEPDEPSSIDGGLITAQYAIVTGINPWVLCCHSSAGGLHAVYLFAVSP